MILQLTGNDLTIAQMREFYANPDAQIEVTDDAYTRVKAAKRIV